MDGFAFLFVDIRADRLIRDRGARHREIALAQKYFPQNCFRCRNSCKSTRDHVPFSRCTIWLTRYVGRYEIST